MDVAARLARTRAPGIEWLAMHAAHRGLLGRRFARILPLDRARRTESGSLYEATAPVCVVPREVDDPLTIVEIAEPLRIEWHRLADACIDTHSSFVVREHEAYLQSAAVSLIGSGASYAAGFCRHTAFTARVTRGVACAIDRGIAVCGCGAFNWYHWLVEVLPRAMLAAKLPARFADWPLVVPPEAASVPQFAESLRLVAGQRTIHISDRGLMCVRDLVWIDSPSISPFNMTQGWPIAEQCFNHQSVLADLAQMLVSPSQRSNCALPKRVILVRSDGRRKYNQSEVVAAAEEFGFQAVSPEMLPLSEQIALFQNAEFIIGPSGAAWTGLLFAKASGRGLIWVAEQYRGLNVFANLAAQQGFDLRYLFHSLPARSTSEAYGAPYELDVTMLRTALQRMLSE